MDAPTSTEPARPDASPDTPTQSARERLRQGLLTDPALAAALMFFTAGAVPALTGGTVMTLLRWFVQVSTSSRRTRPQKGQHRGFLKGCLPSWTRWRPGSGGAMLEFWASPAHRRFLAASPGSRTRHPPPRRPPGIRSCGPGVRGGFPAGRHRRGTGDVRPASATAAANGRPKTGRFLPPARWQELTVGSGAVSASVTAPFGTRQPFRRGSPLTATGPRRACPSWAAHTVICASNEEPRLGRSSRLSPPGRSPGQGL
jgi:hypothetical protein